MMPSDITSLLSCHHPTVYDAHRTLSPARVACEKQVGFNYLGDCDQ